MNNQLLYTTTVGELMSTQLVYLKELDTMDKASDYFKKYSIHHLPVVDDKNQLIGIISLKDYNRILSSMMFFNKKRNEQLNKNLLQSLTATDVMTKQLVTLKPSASLMQAATLFKENRFCAIPIIDEEKGLLGILTTYDLLVFAYQEEPFTVHAA